MPKLLQRSSPLVGSLDEAADNVIYQRGMKNLVNFILRTLIQGLRRVLQRFSYRAGMKDAASVLDGLATGACMSAQPLQEAVYRSAAFCLRRRIDPRSLPSEMDVEAIRAVLETKP